MKRLNFCSFIVLFSVFQILSPTISSAKQVPSNDSSKVYTQEIAITKEQNPRTRALSRIGTLNIWVSTKPKRLNWKITMNPPYRGTGFKGSWSIAELSHGTPTQRVNVTGMSGSITPPMLRNTYGAPLSGKVTPVGYVLGSKYLVYNNY
ncbi:hypothetical protein MFLO_01570 [Listeria floridensis FSL S10-1187]|uniref:Uncharacterized protein n=1 Tax=Listeria floridensis FSL S10-1187 TaxID=1265817 RepID=A0ABP3B3J0_9LIST|nr:hypothetical protein [Listeria floridensis]EUJ33872.1 hypothetical protein MFLO_01570 [Listeria floridensis FSL S10-1187]